MDIVRIPIVKIRRDNNQVRKTFNEQSLEGLAHSLEEVGMLHPILVVQNGDSGYRLVSGERRLRAAQLLGRSEVSAVVLKKDAADEKLIQLVENIQREDLNPVERARAIREFMDEHKLTKVAASEKLGVPRTTLTDWLDILEVDPRYQQAVLENWNGGDSPLTVSHVAEARGLAAKLGSSNIEAILLDAVLEFKLSKAETRQVSMIVKTRGNVSVEEAIGMVRKAIPVTERDEEGAEGRPAGCAQNDPVERLLSSLDRLRVILARLIGGAIGEADEHERHRLVEGLTKLKEWIDDALFVANSPDRQPLPRTVALLQSGRDKRRRRRRSKGIAATVEAAHADQEAGNGGLYEPKSPEAAG